jgi:flagellar protein FlgJ
MNIADIGVLQWRNIQNQRMINGGAGNSQRPDDEKLREVSYDFEAIFIKKMLDSMRSTVPKDGLFGESMARDIFEDMLYDEYSKMMSRTAGLGIADMIYRQLSQNNTPLPPNV